MSNTIAPILSIHRARLNSSHQTRINTLHSRAASTACIDHSGNTTGPPYRAAHIRATSTKPGHRRNSPAVVFMKVHTRYGRPMFRPALRQIDARLTLVPQLLGPLQPW